MAGIGFNLIKALEKNSFVGLFQAYGLTTMIGSGPGLIILIALSTLCFFTLFSIPDPKLSKEFLSAVVYLYSGSMIFSSLLQYLIVRFSADMEYIKRFDKIVPNIIGVSFIQMVASTCVSTPIVCYFFKAYDPLLKILLIASFDVLSLTWVCSTILTEFKAYYRIAWGFILAYGVLLDVHYFFDISHDSLNFLLIEFLLAQCILLTSLLYIIISSQPTKTLIGFEFFKKTNRHYALMFSNFFYCLGFWVDKYLFWFNPDTGLESLAPLKLSPIYDLPMFIAILTMIPGVSVFMLRLETEFAMQYPTVMDAIFQQRTLAEINVLCNQLVKSGQRAIYSLIKGQAMIIIILVLSASYIFKNFNILPIYLPLLFILVLAAGLQIILWSLLNLLYYMTLYKHAFYISFLFATSNCIFTYASLQMGPLYYGYGIGLSLLITIIFAVVLLNKDFKNIQYNTFMLVD